MLKGFRRRRPTYRCPMAAGIVGLASLAMLAGPAMAKDDPDWQTRWVDATAYTTSPYQPGVNRLPLAAWGDVLKPGMRAIAVSRDLIGKGFTYGTLVKIEGLPGIHVVRDKMATRWRNKIDVYMGHDTERAIQWGRKRNIKIHYLEPDDA